MKPVELLTLVLQLATELFELIRTGAKPAEVRRRLADPTRAGAKVLAILSQTSDEIDDYVRGLASADQPEWVAGWLRTFPNQTADGYRHSVEHALPEVYQALKRRDEQRKAGK